MNHPTPLSPAAQAVLDAYGEEIGGTVAITSCERRGIAAALRAVADHINHDWSGFNCVDALCEMAAELEGAR